MDFLKSLELFYSFTSHSLNRKLGDMAAVSTSSPSCPDDCALFNECYGKMSFTGIHWRKLDLSGLTYAQVMNYVDAMRKRSKLRFNVVGDLAHLDGTIDAVKLLKLANTVKNRMIETILYTHHSIDNSLNVSALKLAFSKGLHINISCEDTNKAAQALNLGLNAVIVLPTGSINKVIKHEDLTIVRCPAEYKDSIQCANCMLCAKDRVEKKIIIAFTAHGAKRNALSKKLGGLE
jgi:hypothetical protein